MTASQGLLTRRSFLSAGLGLAAVCGGCGPGASGAPSKPELVWGRRGVSAGRFQRPRAIAIDGDDLLYIVDMTGRIQVFNSEGELQRLWNTPAIEQGKPTGLSFSRDGHLMVADTHYFRILFYTPSGKLVEDRTIGGTHGLGPGEFYFVTDVVEDASGNYYISEYGEFDRVQKFTADRKFVTQWGGHGDAPGQFMRPQSIAFDSERRLWVADACNHRIQIFDVENGEPKYIAGWGKQGAEPGQLSYPYGLILGGGYVYVCEYGNQRVQKFRPDGQWVGTWGRPGRLVGELNQPWAIAQDSRGRLYVLDSYNHRVQRFTL